MYYSRYVDDIVVITTKNSLADIKDKIKNWLSPLKLNEDDKTDELNKREFIDKLKTEKQGDLNETSEEVRKIIKKLYVLPFGLYKDYKKNPNDFSMRYSQALSLIGVNLQAKWLKRKLNIGIMKSAWISFRKKSMIRKLPEDGKEDQWASEFNNRNSEWLDRKNKVTNKSIQILEEAEEKLSSHGEDKIMERRARFAIYRLGLLTNPRVLDLIFKLIRKSSIAPTALRALEAYPEARAFLQDYIKSKPLPYFSSLALLSLTCIDKDAAAKEAFSILNSNNLPAFQKYVVAETLLNTLTHPEKGAISTIYQIWHSNKTPSIAPFTSLLSDKEKYKRDIENRAFDLDEGSFVRLSCQFSFYYPGKNPLDLPEIDPPNYKSEYYPVLPPIGGYYYYGGLFS